LDRRTPIAALACSLLLILSARASAQVDVPARPKITTASAVRVRTAPEVGAGEVTRLKLGTVVSAESRTGEQSEIGGKRDYWYRVGLPGGGSGWVFGRLLADYDPARRSEIVGRVIAERLKAETMSFDDGADLYEFVSAALAEAAGPQARGELELARLRALGLAVSQMPDEVGQMSQPQRDFHKAHKGEIYHHEFAGGWAVNPEAYWGLETKYRGTEVGDRIAWEAAQALAQGECESDEVCQFLGVHGTDGRYLGLYPKGAHAGEALQNIAAALTSTELDASLKGTGGDVYAAQERTALKKALTELRAAVSKADGPEKAAVLKRLDQLSPRVP
jgi:hypothetical protein